jgi:site-specific recombinase XerD
VQRYLGHKNVATTEVYAKISDAQKRASVGCITLRK